MVCFHDHTRGPHTLTMWAVICRVMGESPVSVIRLKELYWKGLTLRQLALKAVSFSSPPPNIFLFSSSSSFNFLMDCFFSFFFLTV